MSTLDNRLQAQIQKVSQKLKEAEKLSDFDARYFSSFIHEYTAYSCIRSCRGKGSLVSKVQDGNTYYFYQPVGSLRKKHGQIYLGNNPAKIRMIRECMQHERAVAEKEAQAISDLKERAGMNGPGRPREYDDHEILESMGKRRKGKEIRERRDVPNEEIWKREWEYLAPDIKDRFGSLAEYQKRRKAFLSARKRANRLSQKWDPVKVATELGLPFCVEVE